MFFFNRVSETKIKELQDELLVQKGNSAKLDAHLEFSKERYEIMKGNIDSNKKVCTTCCVICFVDFCYFNIFSFDFN